MRRTAAAADARISGLADPELATAAAAGERSAFEELYRRNVPAAWRVAQAVAHNRDDASDAVADAFERVFRAVTAGSLSESRAFRPYLLTATRRAAIDISRRACRTAPTDEVERLDAPEADGGPPDRLVADLEARLLTQAFRELPERWRSVLWLIEVEELSAREAAEVLGLSPNNVAQLAVRARAGLRKRYLAACVRDHARPECRVAIERLPAYVEGALGRRRAGGIDGHLAACAACQRRRDELRDMGTTLRRSALPVPVALGAVGARGWDRLAGSPPPAAQPWLESVGGLSVRLPSPEPVMGWFSTLAPQLAAGAPAAERLVSWAAAGVLVLGVSAGVVGAGSEAPTPPVAPPAGAVAGTIAAATGSATTSGGQATAAPGSDHTASRPPPGGGASGVPAASGAGAEAGTAGAAIAPVAAVSFEAVEGIAPPLELVGTLLPGEGVGTALSPLTGSGALALPTPAVPGVITDGVPPVPAPDVGSVVSVPAPVDEVRPKPGAPVELPLPSVALPGAGGVLSPPR